ncbi:MAG TPA: DUF4326 domain-containing protein [Acidimicrobiales bacterium]
MPERIQLSRRKGWRKPEGAIVVARPTIWGNPFVLRQGFTVETRKGRRATWAVIRDGEVVCPDVSKLTAAGIAKRLYRDALLSGDLDITVGHAHDMLAGRDLACWCPLGQPCHADVLLELANRPPATITEVEQ